MPEWWWYVDRETQLEALREVIPDGGCVVLAGDDRSGRDIAARLLIESLQRFGYTPFAVSQVARGATGKRLLLRAWELVAPSPGPQVVPPWVLPGPNLPLGQVIDRVSDALRAVGDAPALLFEDVDRYDRLSSPEASAFCDLARAAACPVIVTSRAESGTDWSTAGANVRSTLNNFEADDILRVLINSPVMRGHTLDELREAADVVTGGAPAVRPSVAYSRLLALSQS